MTLVLCALRLSIIFLVSMISLNSWAGFFSPTVAPEYRVALYQDQILDPNKLTHIILIGSAIKEDSDQFFQSGLSRARRYKEVFPQQQVVIIGSPEVVNKTDEEIFTAYNLNVIKFEKLILTQDRLILELNAFNKIQSLDFFGHSSPWGLKLGMKDAAFDPTTVQKKLRALAPRFTPESYITLNSCNSGFNIAPALSEYLGIPVAGTLTSGSFERLERDGQWRKEDDWSKGNYINQNSITFTENIFCQFTGACTRMKASRYNYSSHWGHFKEGGLSFSKFFCKFQNDDSRCEKAMALSLLTFPSIKPIHTRSHIEEFKDVAFDWLCQTSKDRNYFTKCRQGIEMAVLRGDLIYRSHTKNELNCDFNSCNAKVVCEKNYFSSGPRAGSCKLDTVTTDSPTNVAREYLAIMKGFELLNR